MVARGQPASISPPVSRPGDIRSALEELRARVATLRPDHGLEKLLWAVSEAAEQTVTEHRGMAEELLSVYEQLGIVFEVTRKLSSVQSESEVVELFVESLRHTFARCVVLIARPHPDGGWSAEGHELAIPGWVKDLADRARDAATVLVEPPPPEAPPRAIAEAMIGPVFAGGTFVCAIILVRTGGVRDFQSSDMLLLESLTTFCGDLIRNHRLVRELREMSLAVVRSLVNAVDQKDAYTSGHSLRVGYYATLIGRSLNLDKADLRMLQWGALLHDVGKIGIRDDVLKKEGKLTAEEYEHIKEHPVRSHQVVQGVRHLAGALDGVLHHHERYDGHGYPARLPGEQIPVHARIIQIADVFDALTSDRSYRPAYSWSKALGILEEEAGKLVDPRLAKVFADLIRPMLVSDEQAWDRLVRRASEFTQDDEESYAKPWET